MFTEQEMEDAKKLQKICLGLAKEVSIKVTEYMQDELEKQDIQLRKGVEVVLFPILCQCFTEAWIDSFRAVEKYAAFHENAEVMRYAQKERVRMISGFMKDMSDICKEGCE